VTGPEARSAPDGAGERPLVDIAAGLVLAAMAVFALLWLIPENTEPAMSEFDISPAFIPKLAAWAVLLMSAGFVAHRLWRRPAPADDVSGAAVLSEIAVWAGVGGLTVLGITTVGFLPTAIVLVAAGMIAGGARRWWLVAAIAVLFPLLLDQAAWMIFTVDLP